MENGSRARPGRRYTLVVVFFCLFLAETARQVARLRAGRSIVVIASLLCLAAGLALGLMVPVREGLRSWVWWARALAPWAIAFAMYAAAYYWPDPIVGYALLMTAGGWCIWGIFAMHVWRTWPIGRGESHNG